jgi:hypothetical protein
MKHRTVSPLLAATQALELDDRRLAQYAADVEDPLLLGEVERRAEERISAHMAEPGPADGSEFRVIASAAFLGCAEVSDEQHLALCNQLEMVTAQVRLMMDAVQSNPGAAQRKLFRQRAKRMPECAARVVELVSRCSDAYTHDVARRLMDAANELAALAQKGGRR